jgi:tetratricopeptide (TPR) repeat protein
VRPRLAWVFLFAAAVAAAFAWSRPRNSDASVPEAARESFRLGQHLLRSPTLSQRARAGPYLTEAVRLAPSSARARAHLADAMLWAGRPADAERESARALALDEDEPHALFIGGVLALIRSWDWRRAEALIRRSSDRDPGSAVYQVVLALVLSTAGKATEALSLLDRARVLDPASAILTADIGMMYLYAGRPRKAAEMCEQAARLAPDAMYAHDCALAARSLLGDFPAARAHAATMVRLVGQDEYEVMGSAMERHETALDRYHRWDAARAEADSSRRTFGAALSFVQAGRHAEALEALSGAAASREMGFVTITVDPRLASLRSDTRFQRLIGPLVAQGAARPPLSTGAT